MGRVLIFTASVGAGHEAVGQQLACRLDRAGHEVVIRDGLAQMGRTTHWMMADFYAWQLGHAPWIYDTIFKLTETRPVSWTARRMTGALHSAEILAVIDEVKPDIVVSTYPLVTSAVGALVRNGRLSQPAIATISDFGAHPMWMSPDVDVHLVPSTLTARMVEDRGGNARVARFPLHPRFELPLDRAAARSGLGLPTDVFVPLIVGGAWGVGDISGAAGEALAAGCWPIIVTGRNDRLRTLLAQRFGADPRIRILGWTSEMRKLMAAADCIVQNAGGVTCLEAIELGLPIVMYRPLPGHGRMNARVMSESRVARVAEDGAALRSLFAQCAKGEVTLHAPRSQGGSDAVSMIAAARPIRPRTLAAPVRRIPEIAWTSVGKFAVMCGLVLWLMFSSWPVTLAADKLPVPVVGSEVPTGSAVVSVRADDPAVAGALQAYIADTGLPIALFVTQSAAPGLTVDNGVTIGITEAPRTSHVPHIFAVWDAPRDAASTVEERTGVRPEYFLPLKGDADTVDLALRPRHAVVVVATVGAVGTAEPGVLVVETDGLTTTQAIEALQQEIDAVQNAGLAFVSLNSAS